MKATTTEKQSKRQWGSPQQIAKIVAEATSGVLTSCCILAEMACDGIAYHQ